jgi:acyl dehydratase
MSGVPYGLLRYQLPMLLTGARVIGHTLFNAPGAKAQQIAPMTRVIAAPPAALVEAYLAWAGAGDATACAGRASAGDAGDRADWAAPPGAGAGDGAGRRYLGELPPHMVSQWSLPLVGELLLQMPYKLTSVINQGVSLRVLGPLPRNTPLHLLAAVEQIEETPGRIKVVVAVTTGTADQPTLVEARLHMSFLLPGPRAAKSTQDRPPQPQWDTVGQWHADATDGLRFALLTGDFNPIHWCGPLARRSVFRGLVLHGFGSFVRSYELLKRQGINFSEIDVRFVKPVPLPCSALSVEVAPEDANGWRAIRLAGAENAVHLAGNLR